MTNRARFFRVLEGRPVDRAPFFPDITTWYQASRLGVGAEQPFLPGQYIPDADRIHRRESRLAGRLSRFTILDFHREYDWGLPVHMYDWFEERYGGGVEKVVDTEGRERNVTWRTPRGDLSRRYTLDAEGTWAERGHMVKRPKDLETVRYIVEHTTRVARFERIERFLADTEGFGVCDAVVFRSPFGKLVHELMGFEAVVYALHDGEKTVSDFLEFQEHHDLGFVELAARAPCSVVIISDHADENLISPPFYRKFCIPFYRKACAVIHKAGKYASTHLDGNFKGYLPFIGETGFDLLDGCTPAPMFNYEVEELAAALAPGMSCYCGVPAALFVTGTPHPEIAGFGERIVRAFGGRAVVNVGDILPPNGDIGAVIALGERVASLRAQLG
jgi:uroporphyrinogen-III decarboxylase